MIEYDNGTGLPYFFHGSGSSSLLGVLSERLTHSGRLLDEGKVLFGGELGVGTFAQDGVNKKLISCSTWYNIDCAVDYCLADRSWNPTIGKERMDMCHQHNKDIQTWKISKERLDSLSKTNENILNLEKARLDKWDKLSRIEKKLIHDSFGVIYGFDCNEHDEAIGVNTYNHAMYVGERDFEVGIPSEIAVDKLTIYVPKNKERFVKSLAKKYIKDPKVQSFSKLAPLSDHSQSNNRSFEMLMEREKEHKDTMSLILKYIKNWRQQNE